MLTINLNPDPLAGDWIKTTWDLPPYKSEAFNAMLKGSGKTLAQFKELPVYQYAVESGLIVDDEWAGDSDDPITAG